MTSPPTPPSSPGNGTEGPDQDDELLSAHLDGATTAAESARIAGDPRLAARLDELRAASAAIAAPVPPPSPDRRDDAIAAALAVASNPRSGDEAPLRPVGDLTAARSRHSQLRWVPAAAVIALLAMLLALPIVGSGGDDDGDTMAATGDEATEETDDAGESGEQQLMADGDGTRNEEGAGGLEPLPRTSAPGEASPDAEPGSAAAEAAPTHESLGSFADLPALIEALADAAPFRLDRPATEPGASTGGPAESATAAPAVARCDGVLRAIDPDLAALLLAAPATVAGEDVLVLRYELGDASNRQRRFIVGSAACDVRDARQSEPG